MMPSWLQNMKCFLSLYKFSAIVGPPLTGAEWGPNFPKLLDPPPCIKQFQQNVQSTNEQIELKKRSCVYQESKLKHSVSYCVQSRSHSLIRVLFFSRFLYADRHFDWVIEVF